MQLHFLMLVFRKKMIRDVTGHRSNALQLYERPSVDQQQLVSRILMLGERENCPPQSCNAPCVTTNASCVTTCAPCVTTKNALPHPAVTILDVFGSLFSGLNVNLASQSLVINIGHFVSPPDQVWYFPGTTLGLSAIVFFCTATSYCVLLYYC